MNDHLSQLISLTAYANDYLINDSLNKDFNKNKCLLSTRYIYFAESNKIVLTNNPIEWFKLLKSEKCKRLKLIFKYSETHLTKPDHLSAGIVGGGGQWLIESVYDDHSRYWSSHWLSRFPYARDKRLFEIYYRRQFKKNQISNDYFEVEAIKKQLGATLWEISEFTIKQGIEKWTDFFNKALDNLYGSEPCNEYYYFDLIPKNSYTLSEQQLIYSAGKAFNYGVQGSWNDIGFKDKLSTERYLKISAQLYDDIIKSILAVINK